MKNKYYWEPFVKPHTCEGRTGRKEGSFQGGGCGQDMVIPGDVFGVGVTFKLSAETEARAGQTCVRKEAGL